jgi:hypothetical protein
MRTEYIFVDNGPLGSEYFVEMIEKKLGRILRPQKPGPKKKQG